MFGLRFMADLLVDLIITIELACATALSLKPPFLLMTAGAIK